MQPGLGAHTDVSVHSYVHCYEEEVPLSVKELQSKTQVLHIPMHGRKSAFVNMKE